MKEKKLLMSFLGGFIIIIISFIDKPELCVMSLPIEQFSYNWGFQIGIILMLLSIMVFLIINQKNEKPKEVEKR